MGGTTVIKIRKSLAGGVEVWEDKYALLVYWGREG
jgi:hypothetical protein